MRGGRTEGVSLGVSLALGHTPGALRQAGEGALGLPPSNRERRHPVEAAGTDAEVPSTTLPPHTPTRPHHAPNPRSTPTSHTTSTLCWATILPAGSALGRCRRHRLHRVPHCCCAYARSRAAHHRWPTLVLVAHPHAAAAAAPLCPLHYRRHGRLTRRHRKRMQPGSWIAGAGAALLPRWNP